MKFASVSIPRGILVNGSWIHQVEMRELNGNDEQLLADISEYPVVYRMTKLLCQIITRFGNFGNAIAKSQVEKCVRSLTVGDRNILALHIHRFTFGDRLDSVVSCPNCSKVMSLDFTISQLLEPMVSEPALDCDMDFEGISLKVRPVTAGDLELLLHGDKKTTARALHTEEELIRSCIVSSNPPLPDTLREDFVTAVALKLEELDPQSNLLLNLVCPECHHSFQISFDAEDFFLQELAARGGLLESEVHWLAFNYHWEEKAILSLSMRMRKRYVGLVNKTLAGERQ